VSTNDLIAKAREKASNMLEASIEDIEYRDGWLTVVGTDRRIGLFDIAKKQSGARLSVDSEGEVDGPSWPNGTHICEVEIDPDTGVTEVVRYSAVEELGYVLNPMLVAGQTHGGVAQGVGQAMGEQIVHDPDSGQMLTASFMDYQMPRADDLPDIRMVTREVPTKVNPLGAKGVGEAGTVGAMAAAMNAVNDALAPLGIRHFDMPATPWRVWQAIQTARSSG
jgi:aerobic carbon-monoxide dehydrogenase large subunit